MPNIKSLAETRKWFETTIIPERTISSGYSLNRLWKSPRAYFWGNTEDPNGLCGDTAAYVYERFFQDFGDYITTDGFQIGLILWEKKIFQDKKINHIANVMLVKKKTSPQKYKWFGQKHMAVSANGAGAYTSSALLKLWVYDLYYKEVKDVGIWWKDRDSSMGGTVKLALLHNIDD